MVVLSTRKCNVDERENSLYFFFLLGEGVFYMSGRINRIGLEWFKYLVLKSLGRCLIIKVKDLFIIFRSKV